MKSPQHRLLIEHSDQSNDRTLESKCGCICRYWLPRRYCLVLMLGLGLYNVYTMRVNLSVAIEPMSCQVLFLFIFIIDYINNSKKLYRY